MNTMFQTRLLREEDALLIFEAMAFLMRQSGLPPRPPVPSPLHKNQGIDTLLYRDTDSRNVFDWAQDSFAAILDAMHLSSDGLTLIAAKGPQTAQPGIVTFDPVRTRQPGQFTARLVLDLVRERVSHFDTGFELSELQIAILHLTGCAFYGQGFALLRCQPALREALGETSPPARLIENVLVFATCLGLTIRRQTPEQMIATYGLLMSKSVRKKMRPACRQISVFALEVKLLQILVDSSPARQLPNGFLQDARTSRLRAQPQRTSWT